MRARVPPLARLDKPPVLAAAGIAVTDDHDLPGDRRCHAADPFGNRLEPMAERASPAA